MTPPRSTTDTVIDALYALGTLYGLMAYTCLYAFDHLMPRTSGIMMPTGTTQLFRTASGLYVELWFLGALRFMATIPIAAAMPLLGVHVGLVYTVAFWLGRRAKGSAHV